ncbi:hypothetical protein PHMEG_00020675 [Phytophthora megakarya]|uniref:Uncharacterized protein n=1 Tax=Phytophthora megakarya TaxID=4795 RepID=A0A225VN77_9STRA|nr:hypothetical protein PHMEG_00020675 [Phytophthora megakarya]
MYVDTLVAFNPMKEGFVTQKKKYVGVGSAYLVGGVCRVLKQSLFQINWLDSHFQNHVQTLNISTVQRGNADGVCSRQEDVAGWPFDVVGAVVTVPQHSWLDCVAVPDHFLENVAIAPEFLLCALVAAYWWLLAATRPSPWVADLAAIAPV